MPALKQFGAQLGFLLRKQEDAQGSGWPTSTTASLKATTVQMDPSLASGGPPRLPEKHADRRLSSKRSAPNLRIDIKMERQRTESGDEKMKIAQRPRFNSTATASTTDANLANARSLGIAKHTRGHSHDSINSMGKEHERDSGAYFRRISLLPPSSRNLSTDETVMIDSSRGILFALSQLYSAITQYITLASDERLTGVLNRVLVSANHQLGHFVLALDKFDTSSMYRAPDPKLTNDVLQACSINVSTFRKVVSVLQLQLDPLSKRADIRYSRTLMLLLHGSTNEIRLSWEKLAPVIKSLEQKMAANTAKANGATSVATPPPTTVASAINPRNAARPMLKHQNSAASLFSLASQSTLSPIASASPMSSLPPTPGTASIIPDLSNSAVANAPLNHTRNMSINSLQPPSMPTTPLGTSLAPSAAAAAANLDTDRHLYDLVDAATSAATKVMQAVVNEPWIASPKKATFSPAATPTGTSPNPTESSVITDRIREFKELAGACSEVTRRLMHSLAVIQSGGMVGSARNGHIGNAAAKTFLDDTQAFVHAVIHLSTFAKRLTELSHARSTPLSPSNPTPTSLGPGAEPPTLSRETKANLAVLARCTRELTILFSLSSFRGPATSHGHSSSTGSAMSSNPGTTMTHSEQQEQVPV